MDWVKFCHRQIHMTDSPQGMECKFVRLNDRWGIKTFASKWRGIKQYENQKLLASKNFAPEVGEIVIDNEEDVIEFAYITRCVNGRFNCNITYDWYACHLGIAIYNQFGLLATDLTTHQDNMYYDTDTGEAYLIDCGHLYTRQELINIRLGFVWNETFNDFENGISKIMDKFNRIEW